MRKILNIFFLLFIFGLFLSACGTRIDESVEITLASTEVVPTKEVTTMVASPTNESPISKVPTTFVNVKSDISIDTLDPALAYDYESGEIIQNTYETLVTYKNDENYSFKPVLANSWIVSEDGTVWTFHIRQNVMFHKGGDLTASDVAYSFQRGLLQGGYASPQKYLAEIFFGARIDDISIVVGEDAAADDRETMLTMDPAALVAACEKVQSAIVADDAAGTVTMTLAQSWGPFLATIAQTWGSVMDKEWVIENGGWDGSCDTWQNYYAMQSAEDTFSTLENGTGPFVLSSLKQGEEYILDRFDGYWGEPAKLTKVVAKAVPEWGTRFALMQTGDADIVTVPADKRFEMDELVGEICNFNIESNTYEACLDVNKTLPFRLRVGKPGVSQNVLLFNWSIATSDVDPNPYIGSGKLDGNGVPADFFADLHVRKAFSYCFDWAAIIDDIYEGDAIQSIQLTLPGMPGFFNDTPHYSFDPDKCAEEFQASELKTLEGATLWDTGFRIQLAYNQGSRIRQLYGEVLAQNISNVNDKFQVEVVGLPWALYVSAQRNHMLPILSVGWNEDIHDPQNWYPQFITGFFSQRVSFPDEITTQFESLMENGVSSIDQMERAEIYKEINQLYYDLNMGLPTVLETNHEFVQRDVHGENLNPFISGINYYTIYKD